MTIARPERGGGAKRGFMDAVTIGFCRSACQSILRNKVMIVGKRLKVSAVRCMHCLNWRKRNRQGLSSVGIPADQSVEACDALRVLEKESIKSIELIRFKGRRLGLQEAIANCAGTTKDLSWKPWEPYGVVPGSISLAGHLPMRKQRTKCSGSLRHSREIDRVTETIRTNQRKDDRKER